MSRFLLPFCSVLALLASNSSVFAQAAVTAPAKSTAVDAPVLKPQVTLSTTMGEIVIELMPDRAPVSVENFLAYTRTGFYDGTIFHRVIKSFMVQGGGYMTSLAYKTTRPPIKNEANNGLKNLRGTVAMARMTDPDSASSQFFINTVDNTQLNFTGPQDGRSWGYTVFGRVVKGMDVVDRIQLVPVESSNPEFANKPVESVVIQKAFISQEATPSPAPAVEPAATTPATAKPTGQ